MADPVSLWPVVVGGLIALGGVGITTGINFVMKRAETQEAKRKRRAEKFEELVQAVFEFDHWLDRKKSRSITGNDEKIEMSPFAKIETISAIYFPQFSKTISELELATFPYEKWMVQAVLKRLDNKVDQAGEGFDEVYKPYAQKRSDLVGSKNGNGREAVS